jgi:hypothetical protein
MKITEKQYLKAKAIVSAYEQQFHKTAVRRSFKKEDLTILERSILIESLTEDVVDEDFASILQDKIEDKLGRHIKWVNLDDLGCISISFGIVDDELIESEHINAVLSALNDT